VKFTLTAVCCAILPFVAPARGEGAVEGVIQDVTIGGPNFARVAVGTVAVGGRPACHNAAYTTHWGFDISTAKGKATLSVATAALLASRRVYVIGTNGCVDVGSIRLEEVDTIVLGRP
jgi:hypothetical protein